MSLLEQAPALERGAQDQGARDREAQESHVLDVAGEAFALNRYAWTRMDDVAAACGISKPQLYRLFGSKAGTYEAVVRRLDEAVRTALAAAPAAEGLQVLLEVLDHRRHLWTVTFDETAPFLPGDESVVSACRERLAGLARLTVLTEQATGPRSRRDELLHRALHHGAGRALVDWWATQPEESARSVLARVARIHPRPHGAAGPHGLTEQHGRTEQEWPA